MQIVVCLDGKPHMEGWLVSGVSFRECFLRSIMVSGVLSWMCPVECALSCRVCLVLSGLSCPVRFVLSCRMCPIGGVPCPVGVILSVTSYAGCPPSGVFVASVVSSVLSSCISLLSSICFAAFEPQGAMGMGGGMGMAQGGGMMMAGGMGMGYGMMQDAGMGYGMMQDGGMAYGMGQDGGMVMGGGINAVPSLMPNGQQMGSVGGRQQMAGSTMTSQGSGVNPSSGTVNLLLGLTQMLR